jgi:membrane protease YdiL (CAAX protease family)
MSNQQALNSLVERYEISLFYVLAFVLSWLVWGSAVAQQRGLTTFSLPDMVAYFAVTLSALLMAGLFEGRSGIRDLFSRMFRWRVGWHWYLIAVLLPIGLQLLAAGVYRLFGGNVQMGRLASISDSLHYFIVATPFMMLTEELGWRGFALPRLQVKYRALTASLVVGVLWGVWHSPLFLMPGTSWESFPYVGFVLSATAQSILTSWVFNNTKGSVLLASIFHTATNGTGAYVAMGVGDVWAFWTFTAVQWIAVLVIVVLEGAENLSRRQSANQPPVTPLAYHAHLNDSTA